MKATTTSNVLIRSPVALAVAALLLLPLACSSTHAPESASSAQVKYIVDGDTLDVDTLALPPGPWRIRLHAVDTPELPDEPGAVEATEALQRMVEGRPIRVEHAREPFALGDFGRLLAYVWFVDDNGNERNANLELVRHGWARYFTSYGTSRYDADFREAEQEARSARRGVWGMPERHWPIWPEDINTVPQEWLEEIPGVGPITAKRVIDYRRNHGPIQSINDLRNANIREPILNRLRDHLHTGE